MRRALVAGPAVVWLLAVLSHRMPEGIVNPEALATDGSAA